MIQNKGRVGAGAELGGLPWTGLWRRPLTRSSSPAHRQPRSRKVGWGGGAEAQALDDERVAVGLTQGGWWGSLVARPSAPAERRVYPASWWVLTCREQGPSRPAAGVLMRLQSRWKAVAAPEGGGLGGRELDQHGHARPGPCPRWE